MSNPHVQDLLVVGGGIVGAGVIRDAALRGLDCTLVEQYDFGFGTSSRSSRLLHGGIRYLAQGRIGLVREASREKKILHKIAPHLSEPLAFIFPTYKGSGWVRWKLSIGVKLYDILCGGSNLGPSQTLSRNTLLEKVPGLTPDRLTGGVRYYDAKTQDVRLVIDTLRSAEKYGATLHNYYRFEDAHYEGDHWQAKILDVESHRTFTIRARSIVNATGPWSENLPNSNTIIRPTKGVHIVIDHNRLPISDALVMPEGNRILFAIPWNERTYLGTTDTDYDGSPEAVACAPEDIDYILRIANTYFPKAILTSDDILSAWAGLRPLIASKNGNPSDISRKHEIKLSPQGWMDITGGKLTTYRLMAEQAIDQLLPHLNMDHRHSTSAEIPLVEDPHQLPFSKIAPCPLSKEAVTYYVRCEWARHLEDLMIRRSGWHYYLHQHEEAARQVADWMAELLNWTPEYKKAQLETYSALPVV